MLECGNCGQHLGHIYEDYYTLSKQLTDELKDGGVPSGTYVATSGDDVSAFINTYYLWFKGEHEGPIPIHEPENIVARALLRIKELDPEELPFGSSREADGQLSIFEPRICCLRMLQTDPMMTKI